jgi:hypothetical protein
MHLGEDCPPVKAMRGCREPVRSKKDPLLKLRLKLTEKEDSRRFAGQAVRGDQPQ